MNRVTTVGISDMKVIRNEGQLITYALGSCIGICLYDPEIKLASLTHIMLPEAPLAGPDQVFKYADSGIAETLKKIQIFGGLKRRLRAKIAGGAKMFNIPGDSSFGNIGARNIEAVVAILRREGIILIGQEVGGGTARTLLLSAETGVATIRTFGQTERNL